MTPGAFWYSASTCRKRAALPSASVASWNACVAVPSIASEFEDLGPTIEDAIDDVENWLVEDSPFDVSRQDVQDFRDEADDRVGQILESQSGTLISGTILVFEVFAGIVLALVTTFFILKDGDRFGDWFVKR